MRKTIFGMEVERFIGGVSSNLNIAGDTTPESNVFGKILAAEKAAKKAKKAAKKAANKVLAEKKAEKELKKGAKVTAPKGRPTPKRESKRVIAVEMPEVEKKVEYSQEYLTALEKVKKGGAKGLVAKLIADVLASGSFVTKQKEHWNYETSNWEKTDGVVVRKESGEFVAVFEDDKITEFGHIFEDVMKKDYEAFIESEIDKRVSVEGRFAKETAKYFTDVEFRKEKSERTSLTSIARVAEIARSMDITVRRNRWEPSIELVAEAVERHGKYAKRAIEYAFSFSKLEQLQAQYAYMTGVQHGGAIDSDSKSNANQIGVPSEKARVKKLPAKQSTVQYFNEKVQKEHD